METQQKFAAEEVQKFCSTLKNLIAFGSEIEKVIALEDRAAYASRTLAEAEARHKAILTVANFEESAAAAEKRIAALNEQEQATTSAKEQVEKSLAAAREELKTVTADLDALKKQRAEIKAIVDKVLKESAQ